MTFSRPSFPLVSPDAQAFEVLAEGSLGKDRGVLEGRAFVDLRSRTPLELSLLGPMKDEIEAAKGNVAGLLLMSARSTLGRLGIEIEPIQDDSTAVEANTLETSHRLIAAGRDSEPVLEVIRDIVKRTNGSLGLGRHVLLPERHLNAVEVAAHNGGWFLLPETASIGEDGTVSIPINDAHYTVRRRVLKDPQRIEGILNRHKFGLDRVQGRRSGLSARLAPGDVLVSDINLSLGPVYGVVGGTKDAPHLAPVLLDPLRSSGLAVPRHVELLNLTDAAMDPKGLFASLQIYPASEIVRGMAERLLPDRKAHVQGVHIENVLNIDSHRLVELLMRDLTAEPSEGGIYARVLAPGRVAEFKWPEADQVPCLPEDLCDEVPQLLNGAHGVEDRLVDSTLYAAVMDAVSYVGGPLTQKNIVSLDTLPGVDVLKSLTKDGVGVFFVRHLREGNSINVDRDTFVELCHLSRGGTRFFLVAPDQSVRVFHNEAWVDPKDRERLDKAHTGVVFYGTSISGSFEHLTPEFEAFFEGLAAMEELDYGEGVLEIDGNGPGVMQMASAAARQKKIMTMGIGTDLGAIEQDGSRRPDAWITFTQGARTTRQDLMERRAAFRVINVGGFGTGEELYNTLTNKKVLNSLPMPVILMDPKAKGKDEHFWEDTKVQIQKFVETGTLPKSSEWVAKCLHFVDGPAQALEVIQDFVRDPVAYWTRIGVSVAHLKAAFKSCEQISRDSGFMIPPYIVKAVATL